MNDNMKNVAYTSEYLKTFSDTYLKAITPGCSVEEEQKELGNGISILSKTSIYMYYPDNSQIQHRVFGSENTIFRNNTEIYSFKTINDDSRSKVFTHRNGHEYIFFKKNLYGYSILDLSAMRDFDYFPVASFPVGETFIWCEPFYNPINNMIAVDGCFWAGPYGVILVDFNDPLSSSQQIEVSGYMEQIYHDNYDCTFHAWNGTDLILTNDGIISSSEYMNWFQKRN